MSGVLAVTLAALVTALATGLGALPFVFVHGTSRRWLGTSNALAAGFMLSASGLLLIEGLIRGVGRVLAGAAVGAVFIAITHRLIAGTGGSSPRWAARRGRDQGDPDHRRDDAPLLQRGSRDRSLLRRRRGARRLHHDRDRDPQHPGGARDQPGARAARVALCWRRRGGACSRACRSRSSRRSHTSSSSRSARSCRPGSASPPAAMAWLVFSELLPDARAELGRRSLALWLGGSLVAMSLLQTLLLAR